MTHRVPRGGWQRDAVLVVGDDPEVVGGGGQEVLVGDEVLLLGAALRLRLRLPLVLVYVRVCAVSN